MSRSDAASTAGEGSRAPSARRLATADSPYLRAHADDPVDWWPWSDEAFAEARRLDRPVFLSVGYAACHWCHVMHRESFADPRTAERLNGGFISIKVDREEFPEVDAFAMSVLLELTGDAGWPASVFLSPDKVPLDGGTYFPPVYRYGTPAFTEVLRRVEQAWGGRSRDSWLQRGRDAVAATQPSPQAPPSGPERAQSGGDDLGEAAVAALVEQADPRGGGWGEGAKFPHPPRLALLVEEGRSGAAEHALAAALEALERGGLHDHVGGGFHRYTVDSDWHVPHFEKMLVDNAQLAAVLVDAWARLGEPQWLRAGCATVEWLLDVLRLPSGAFAASLDADDPGGEGAFYTWTPGEVRAALGPLAPAAMTALGVEEGGHIDGGRSVVRRLGSPGVLAACRPKLRRARARRPPPARDDKAVVAYNGLALHALATAAGRLGEARYRQAGEAIAEAIVSVAKAQGGLHRTLAAEAPPAVLSDRAAVAWGLLHLHSVTGSWRWLDAASELAAELLTHHQDPDCGALLMAPVGRSAVGAPRSPLADGAEPSGVGLALLVLQRLQALGDTRLPDDAVDRARHAAQRAVTAHPERAPTVVRALQRFARPPATLVVTGTPSATETQALITAAARRAPHDLAVAVGDPEREPAQRFGCFAQRGRPGVAQAWLCEGTACQLPVSTPEALDALLRARSG